MDDKLNEVTKSGWIIKDTRSGHYVGNRHGSMSIPHKDKAHVFSSEDEAHELSSKFFGNHEVIRHSISEPKKLDKTITNKLSSIRDQLKGLKEETDLNEVVLNVAQRIKRGQTMRRNKSKLKRGREIAANRPADAEHIKRRAAEQARDLVRARYAGKYGAQYVDLSTSQKISIDRAIDGKQKLIQKLALRLIPRVKQADMAKLAHGHRVAEDMDANPLNAIFAEAFKKKKTEPEQKGDSPNVNLLNRFDNKVSSALTKKAEKSGCTVETLVKVYARGLKSWNESSNMSPEQYAFGRVNSFINGGKAIQEDLDLHEAETPGRKPKATDRFAKKHEKTTDEYGSELYTHKDGRSGYVVGHDRKKPGHVLLRVLKTTGVRHSKTEQYEDHSVHGNDLRVSKSGDTGPAKGNLKLKVNKPSGENQYKKNQRVYLKKEFGPNAPDSGTVHAENDTHVLVNVFGRGKLKVAKEHVSHDPAHKWNAKKVSESLDEGKMKELAADLRDMDHGNFKKKYGKSREQLSHELNGKPKPIQEISDITKASYKDKAKTQLGAEKLFYDKEHHAKLKSTLGSNDPVVKHMDKQSNTIRKRETGLKKVEEGISIGNSVDVDPGKKGGPKYDAIALSSKGTKLKAKTTAGSVVTALKDQVKPDPIADQAALKRKQLIKNKILETVKTGDKEPVVIPAHKDEYGNTIPANTVMRKRNKKILGAGNVHDGEGN